VAVARALVPREEEPVVSTAPRSCVIFCGSRPPKTEDPEELRAWRRVRSNDIQQAWDAWEHQYGPIHMIVEGEARGIDVLARDLARVAAIPFVGWPADWATQGYGAGPVRNRQMASFPLVTGCVAVWDGKSPDTRDMIEVLPTLIWRYNNSENPAEFIDERLRSVSPMWQKYHRSCGRIRRGGLHRMP
jgi:hypothetical protein